MTKETMAKVITTVYFNLDEVVSPKRPVAWRHLKSICRQRKADVESMYFHAVKALDVKKYPPEFFGFAGQ